MLSAAYVPSRACPACARRLTSREMLAPHLLFRSKRKGSHLRRCPFVCGGGGVGWGVVCMCARVFERLISWRKLFASLRKVYSNGCVFHPVKMQKNTPQSDSRGRQSLCLHPGLDTRVLACTQGRVHMSSLVCTQIFLSPPFLRHGLEKGLSRSYAYFARVNEEAHQKGDRTRRQHAHHFHHYLLTNLITR